MAPGQTHTQREKERGEYIIDERRKRGHPHRGELFFLDTRGLITRIATTAIFF
jgi:hypothetical protein